MSLVPPTYLCCQPRADQAVSGKATVPRPVWHQEPDVPPSYSGRVITKYAFYYRIAELTADDIHAWACFCAPDQHDSAVSRISARDAAGSSEASESI